MPNDQLSNPLMPGGSQQAPMQPSMPMAEYVATPPQGYYAPAQMQPSMPMAEYIAAPPQDYYASIQMAPNQAAMQRVAQFYANQGPMVQPGMPSYQNAANQMRQAAQAMQSYLPPQQPSLQYPPNTVYMPVQNNQVQSGMQQAIQNAYGSAASQVRPTTPYVAPTMYMNAPMQPTIDVPPAPLFQPMPAQAQPNTGGGYIVEALNMPSQNAGGENLA